MRHVGGDGARRTSWIPTGWRRTAPAAVLAAALLVVTACTPGGSTGNGSAKQAKGHPTLVVWTDPIRQPGFQAYAKAHPDVTLKIETIPQDPTQKIQLDNKAGEGWPDVVYTNAAIATELANTQYHYAADIAADLPAGLVRKFAPGTMTPCTDGSKVTCLRNDFAPGLLWYNPTLMKRFGYAVPTTWEDYLALGLRVAREHPGYVVGAAGDKWEDQVYYQPSQCPVHQVLSGDKVKVDLTDPKCTRVATMMDKLIKAGSMARSGVVDASFIKNYGRPGKVLMSYGPIWYGLNVYQKMYASAPGTVAIAAPLKWHDQTTASTGDIGGGAYVVSRHSKYQQAGADLARWMATGAYQSDPKTVTFPAYGPQQAQWIARNVQARTLGTAASTSATQVIASAATKVWTGYGAIADVQAVYGATVTPALATGKTMTGTLPAWSSALRNNLRAAGYQIVAK